MIERVDQTKAAVTEAWFAFTTRAGKGQGIFRWKAAGAERS